MSCVPVERRSDPPGCAIGGHQTASQTVTRHPVFTRPRSLAGGGELLSIELLEEHARRLAALLSIAPRHGGSGRAHLRQVDAHMRALRRCLHGARGGRAARRHVACGRMAAGQLPHHRGRRARHPSRSPARVLQAAASYRRRRVRRAPAHIRARARADRMQRRPARSAAASAVHQCLPVGDAPHDGRALGLAERAEARAPRPPAHESGRARSQPRAPTRGGSAGRSRRSCARLPRPVAGARPSRLCHAPASALACPRCHRIGFAPSARRGAGGPRPDGRGRHPGRRTAPGGRTGRHGQPDWQPPPDLGHSIGASSSKA